MKKYLTLIIFAAISIANAALPDIVALVNNEPITLYEFQSRKKLFIVLNNVQHIDATVDKELAKAAINSLIDEQILFQHSKKVGGNISEEEIDEAIVTIEQRNKMTKGQLLAYLKSKGADINSFRTQMKAELIKMNILSSISKSIKVTPREIDAAVLSINAKDAHVQAEIFTSIDKSDKTLAKMYDLQKRLNDCNNLKESMYNHIATKTKIDGELSKLAPSLQGPIKDLAANEASSVFETPEGFKLILVCSKKLSGVSDEENTYIVNLINNKKMSQKAVKFFQDLRKKAYVKVMLP